MVQRRHDDGDALLPNDPHPVEEMLFGRQCTAGRPAWCRTELVDELVDPGC